LNSKNKIGRSLKDIIEEEVAGFESRCGTGSRLKIKKSPAIIEASIREAILNKLNRYMIKCYL
jgi:hypothetical protein